MTGASLGVAGKALIWRGLQFGGIKLLFLIRLLILARLLTPEDFGLVAIAIAAIGFLLNLTDFGMVPALVQGASVAEDHYDVAWTVGVTRALLVAGGIFLAAPLIAALFAEPRVVPIIQVLAVRPLLEALTSIKVVDFHRHLQFRPLALLGLLDVVANAVVSILLAPHLGVWALVAGALAGSTIHLLMSYYWAPHRPRLLFDRTTALPLIQFGRWIFLASLVAMAGGYVLQVTISRQLGAAELGLYSVGAQLAFLPATAASEVIGSVAFPFFARLQSQIDSAVRAFRIVLFGVIALLWPIYALLAVLAPSIAHEILGPQWAASAPVIRILAVAAMIGCFGETVGPVLKGFGQPQWVVLIEVVQSAILVMCVWMFTSRYGISGAALAWLPAILASQVFNGILVRRVLLRPLAGVAGPLAAIFVASATGTLVAFATITIVSGLPGLILASLLAMLITGSVLWAVDRHLGLGLADNAREAFPQLVPLFRLSSADG